MKKSKVALFLLVACGLVSCNKVDDSSVVSSTSARSSTSPVVASSSSPTAVSSSSETPVVSSDEAEVGAGISSSEDETSVSSSTGFDYSSTKWNRTNVDIMLLHLNNRVIPYVSTTYQDASWVYSYNSYSSDFGYVEIETEIENTTANLTTFETTYTKAGWTKVSSTEYTFDDLTVDLVDDGGFIMIHASMAETYDASKATAGWDEYVLDEFNADLDNQANLIPYFYMGTAHNVSNPYWASYTHTLYVLGGPWNDDSLTQAANAFTSALGWTNATTSDSTFTASLTTTANAEFNVTISQGSNSSVQLAIKYIPAYDPTQYTDWSADTKQAFTDDLDDHQLPFFYIGTDDPTISYYTYSTPYSMYMTGGYFHDQMLTDSKTVFDNNGWTTESGTNYYGNTLIAYKQFSDGCYIYINFGTNYSSNAYVIISYLPKVVVPTGTSAYEDATLTAMNTYLGSSHTIPYFYLNLSTLTTPAETVSYDKVTRTLHVYGGEWNSNIVFNTQADGGLSDWTISTCTTAEFDATKTYDDGDTIAIKMSEVTDYYSNYYGDTDMALTLKEKWNPGTETAWDDNTKTAMTTDLGTSAIPHLYLGATNVFNDYDATNSTLTLYGNAFDSTALATNFAAAFNNTTTTSTDTDGTTTTWYWSADSEASTDENGDPVYTAIGNNKADGTGDRLLVQVQKDSHGFTIMTITYLEAFHSSDLTAWTDANKTVFASAFGTTDQNELPFVYLGTKNPTTTADGTTVTINGGGWDSDVLTLCHAAFTSETGRDASDGWTVEDSGNANNYMFTAYKSLASGAALRVFVYSTSSTLAAHIAMTVYYDPALTSTNASNLTATDWPSAVKTSIETQYGQDLPYFSVPALPSYGYYSSYAGAFNLYTYSLSDTNNTTPYFTWVLKAKSDIEAKGGTVDLDITGGDGSISPYGYFFYAKLPVDQNDATKGFFLIAYSVNYYTSSGSYDIYFNYYPQFDATSATAWTSSITTKMNGLFGETVPFVYLGTTKPTVSASYSTSSMTLTGQTWDDSILTTATTTLTEASYTVTEDDINYPSTAIVATKTSGTKKLIVAIYDDTNKAYGKAVPTMKIYLK